MDGERIEAYERHLADLRERKAEAAKELRRLRREASPTPTFGQAFAFSWERHRKAGMFVSAVVGCVFASNQGALVGVAAVIGHVFATALVTGAAVRFSRRFRSHIETQAPRSLVAERRTWSSITLPEVP